MISLHFSEQPVIDFTSAAAADLPKFNKLFHHMLDHGIYLPPSAYESWFLNNALTYEDLDKVVNCLEDFMKIS
jgi:glutamate-1-semialdehyde 2,1-aminomutase